MYVIDIWCWFLKLCYYEVTQIIVENLCVYLKIIPLSFSCFSKEWIVFTALWLVLNIKTSYKRFSVSSNTFYIFNFYDNFLSGYKVCSLYNMLKMQINKKRENRLHLTSLFTCFSCLVYFWLINIFKEISFVICFCCFSILFIVCAFIMFYLDKKFTFSKILVS